MAQTQPTSIFHQVQQIIADQLNSDEMLSAANVTFVAENSKAIDYEVQNALGKQGIVGVVMTPKADYIGITDLGELAYELRDITVQIVENVPVNRGLPGSTTALDAAQRAQEILASPNFTTFGVMNPVSIEQGEDSGLIVSQAKFNCSVRAKYSGPKTTKVKYTDGRNVELNIKGTLGRGSIPDREYISELDIGSAVTSIEYSAFKGCTNLTSVTIPNSVTNIGPDAFRDCSSLTSVMIPDSVIDVASDAFRDCSGLTEVTIPQVLCDGNFGNVFSGYNAIELYVSDSVTSIVDGAFTGCNIKSVVIGNSVTSIGNYAFSDCSRLTSVTLPDSVTSIGDSAFSRCEELTSVTIPNSVTSIGDGVFSGCISLTSVTIPDSVTSIGESAFYSCSGLESVVIGNSVTNIRDYAFQYCSALTSVTIGNSVASIGYYAFAGCERLTDVPIPDSVTSIDEYAFDNCSGLTSVTIPDSVTDIGYGAFSGCSQLMDVYFYDKDTATVQGMDNYYWELPYGCVLHCTDGDITID